MNKIKLDDLSHWVIGCAIEVHKELGPGLLESTYQKCLVHELKINQISCESELELPVKYKEVQIECGYRIDVLVENAIILELKSVNELTPIHHAQLLTYMKLAGIQHGFLINFNVRLLKDGLKSLLL